MKIQIDTEKKVIKVEGTVGLDDMFKVIKKLLPENEWKDYSLESNTVINNWGNPIVIERWPQVYPYTTPYYGDTTPIPVTIPLIYGKNTTTINYEINN